MSSFWTGFEKAAEGSSYEPTKGDRWLRGMPLTAAKHAPKGQKFKAFREGAGHIYKEEAKGAVKGLGVGGALGAVAGGIAGGIHGKSLAGAGRGAAMGAAGGGLFGASVGSIHRGTKAHWNDKGRGIVQKYKDAPRGEAGNK